MRQWVGAAAALRQWVSATAALRQWAGATPLMTPLLQPSPLLPPLPIHGPPLAMILPTTASQPATCIHMAFTWHFTHHQRLTNMSTRVRARTHAHAPPPTSHHLNCTHLDIIVGVAHHQRLTQPIQPLQRLQRPRGRRQQRHPLPLLHLVCVVHPGAQIIIFRVKGFRVLKF